MTNKFGIDTEKAKKSEIILRQQMIEKNYLKFSTNDFEFLKELINIFKPKFNDVNYIMYYDLLAEIVLNNHNSLFVSSDLCGYRVMAAKFINCKDDHNKVRLMPKNVIRIDIDETFKLYPELIYFLDKIIIN